MARFLAVLSFLDIQPSVAAARLVGYSKVWALTGQNFLALKMVPEE